MHTVIVIMTCKPGLREGIAESLPASQVETRAFEGCLLLEMYLDQDHPDKIMMWEKWESRAYQEKYIAWRMETGMLEALEPILAEPLEVMHYSSY